MILSADILHLTDWRLRVVDGLPASHGHRDWHMPRGAPKWDRPSGISRHRASCCCSETPFLPLRRRRGWLQLPQLPTWGLCGGGAVYRCGQRVQWVLELCKTPQRTPIHASCCNSGHRSQDKVIMRPQWNASAEKSLACSVISVFCLQSVLLSWLCLRISKKIWQLCFAWCVFYFFQS